MDLFGPARGFVEFTGDDAVLSMAYELYRMLIAYVAHLKFKYQQRVPTFSF